MIIPLQGDVQELQREFDEHYLPNMEARPEKGYYILHGLKKLTPPFMAAINALDMGEIAAILFTAADAGYSVHKHQDRDWEEGLPVRYHLPIYTNHTILYENGKPIHMYEGSWYGPIRYWLPHSVEHDSDFKRVHLIVDFHKEKRP